MIKKFFAVAIFLSLTQKVIADQAAQTIIEKPWYATSGSRKAASVGAGIAGTVLGGRTYSAMTVISMACKEFGFAYRIAQAQNVFPPEDFMKLCVKEGMRAGGWSVVTGYLAYKSFKFAYEPFKDENQEPGKHIGSRWY